MRSLSYRAFLVCVFAALILLAGGFGLAHLWWGEVFVLAIIFFWLIFQRSDWNLLPSALLAIYVCVAAAGLLSGVSPFLMIAGAAVALASWELADQRVNLPGTSNHALVSLYEHHHMKILGITVGLGLLVAEAGLFLQFSIPFGVLVLIALVVLFSLYRFFSLFKKK